MYGMGENSENTEKIDTNPLFHDMEKMDEQNTAERSVEVSYKKYATKITYYIKFRRSKKPS